MITVKDIRDKVNQYPDNAPADALIDELVLWYKITNGIQEADAGKGLSLTDAEKDMQQWWKSK